MQLAHVARRADPEIEIIGYLNDFEPVGALIGAAPVLGPFEAWESLDRDVCFACDLHSAGRMAERSGRIDRLGVARDRWHTCVDPAAVLYEGVVLGVNVGVGPNAAIKTQAKIADHVAVRDGASLGHDAVLEDHAFVVTNASVGGYTIVCRGAYVGMGATIRERLRIGAMSVVGMGAVVVDDVPDGAVVVGNPARILPPSGAAS